MTRRVVTAILVALAVVAGSGCTVNPVTGKSQLDLMGEAQEIELGKSLYPSSIQESLGPIEDERVQRMVAEVGQKLAEVSHRPALPYEFTAVSDPALTHLPCRAARFITRLLMPG
jgi:predicted Zn-dependent protease